MLFFLKFPKFKVNKLNIVIVRVHQHKNHGNYSAKKLRSVTNTSMYG